MMSEVARVLEPGGCYLQITHSPPSSRLRWVVDSDPLFHCSSMNTCLGDRNMARRAGLLLLLLVVHLTWLRRRLPCWGGRWMRSLT